MKCTLTSKFGAGGFGLLFLILGIMFFAGVGVLKASSRCTRWCHPFLSSLEFYLSYLQHATLGASTINGDGHTSRPNILRVNYSVRLLHWMRNNILVLLVWSPNSCFFGERT